MGIVFKHSFNNSIVSFAGVAVATITTIVVLPNVLEKHPAEEWGFIQLMISYAFLLMPIGSLGLPNTIIKFSPHYNEQQKIHFWFAATLIAIVITSLLLIAFYAFYHAGSSVQNIELWDNHKYSMIPLMFGFVLMEIFNAISRTIHITTLPIFLRELFLRLIQLAALLLYYYDYLSFFSFLSVYMWSYMLIILILFIFLLTKIKIPKIDFSIFHTLSLKRIISFNSFSLLSRIMNSALLRIDYILVERLIGLKLAAFYSIPLFIGNLIQIPSRSIMAIALPLISKSWKDNDLDQIRDIYQKTAINQLLISCFIFLGIWINIDFVMVIIGEHIVGTEIRWVILILGLKSIVSSAAGVNGGILNQSESYKAFFVVQVGVVIVLITFGILLIPVYGVIGAALAVFIGIFIQNLTNSLLLQIIYKLHPITRSYFIAIGVILLSFACAYVLPAIQPMIVDVVIRSIVFSGLYLGLIYLTKVSPEMTDNITILIRKVLSFFK